MKYPELTPEDLTVLRVFKALETAYRHEREPGPTSATAILAGHGAWMERQRGQTRQEGTP